MNGARLWWRYSTLAGGCWSGHSQHALLDHRGNCYPRQRYDALGVRLARRVP